MDVYQKLEEMGLKLPKAPAKGGVYSPCVKFNGNLVYVSGCGPAIGDKGYTGKVGAEYDLAKGQEAARDAMLNVLAVLNDYVGDLNRIKPVKILTFVASADDFYQQPTVANGGSELLAAIYGGDNVPARSAIGLNVLPGNIPVETEGLFEILG